MKRVKRQKKGYVLREGEATGHAHVITKEVELFDKGNDTMLLRTDKPIEIEHEEHDTQVIKKIGDLDVEGVQEYNPLTKIIERVQD